MADGRRISLSLDEGFLDDKVRILAGARELAAFDRLSTRVQIGLAEALDVELAEGEEQITVLLPDKQLRADIPVAQGAGPFVSVSVADGGGALRVDVSKAPRFYL